jgi:exonuclease SbcC
MIRCQRSTGNWSTAWIDGQEIDRKTILNRLTQANWLDTSPRQQTLESLFRATHLFGQDEQELLTEFQKGSVIPEAFISEMLALQDYSQGLVKVTDVIAQLSGYCSALDQELTQVKADSNSLLASLPAPADSEGPHLTPIEGVIADLRQKMVSSEITLQAPPESLDYAAYSEWQEVIAARGAAAAERIQLAHTLRDELPGCQRLVSEDVLLQKQLEDIDGQLESAKAEDREITRRVDANASALNEAEATLKRRQQRRQNLRSLSEGQSERHDLTKQIANLQLERD